MVGRICLATSVMLLSLLTGKNQVNIDNNIEGPEECCFCDGHELTTSEKYEELLVKILTDEKNWLDDGKITKEVYELQIEPVNLALNYLESATDDEIKVFYKEILLLNLDWLDSDMEAGEKIDEGFYKYLEKELEKIEY